jgi:hypothetical protein
MIVLQNVNRLGEYLSLFNVILGYVIDRANIYQA